MFFTERRYAMRALLLITALALTAACSDDDNGVALDSGVWQLDGKAQKDKGSAKKDKGSGKKDLPRADASGAVVKEKEPNDGATSTDFQSVSWPVKITGAIGKAGDTDIFGINVKAGDRLVATVKRAGPLQPHLAMFDPKGKLLTVVNAGAKDTMAEYYAIKDGLLLVALRDRRNVAKPPQNVGGSSFTYTLTIARLARAPIPVTVSVEKTGSLSPSGTVRVFSYTATKNLDMQLTVKAKKLAKPSKVDSRLTLFHPGQKAWLGTNDNPSLGVTDSILKGRMPFNGTYHAIVENVELGATDLRFAFRVTTIK